MWSYYGSKTDQAKHYPVPVHGKIIEPFAGAAKYSLLHWEKEVVLVDKYEVIIRIWKWLQQCSKKDIISLPQLKEGDKLENLQWDCEEQRWFMGFIIAAGDATPRNKVSYRCSTARPNRQKTRLKNAANSLEKIRHWNIIHGDYQDLKNEEATWFIDPPYQYGGHAYKFGNKGIDYEHLGQWSRDRKGQVIVCETTKADWLPFKPMVIIKGTKDKTAEGIWSNLPTAFDNEQLSVFDS